MADEKPRPMQRFLRFCLRLLPFEFRFDHGREIEQTFHAQHLDAAREGNVSLGRLWLEFLAGMLRTAPREHLSILRLDATYAWRRMRQNPLYSLAVIFTLALGIGANTAIFSVVNGVLLRPLPYGEGERLLVLRQSAPRVGIQDINFSEKEINDFREQNHTLDGLVEYHSMVFILIAQEPYRVQTGVVSPEFFDFFGVRPMLGRTFRAEDDVQGSEGVLILSYPFWQRIFGGDKSVVGRVLRMNDRPHTVIGVLPPLPQYPDENDVYMPVSHCPFRSSPRVRSNRNARMSTVFARIKPGTPMPQVQTDLATIAQRLQTSYPESYPMDSGYTATAFSLKEELVSRARLTFLVLLATAGFVLLIACANVANLTLSRVISRERELAIRTALGANRGRLVRQLLTESTMLSLAGGVVGFGLASFGLDLLINFASRFTPRTADIQMDSTVLLFTLGASLFTGVLFGSLPALSSAQEVALSLKEGSRSSAGRRPQLARNILIVAQVSLSIVLLTGAGLMLRSFVHLIQVSPGFSGENVLAARISLNFSKYSDPDAKKARQKQMEFHKAVLRKLDEHPGIVARAFTSSYPMMPGATPNIQPFQIEGQPVAAGQPAPRTETRTVTPDYFRAIGVPLLRGRVLEDRDTSESEPVVVVNQAFAHYYFKDDDPLNKRIGFGEPVSWVKIVGVVGDVKEFGPREQTPLEVYGSYEQGGFLNRLVVRCTSDPFRMAQVVRQVVREVDPEQPVDQFRTLDQVRQEAVAAPRLTTMLLGIFATLALLITAAGIGGVLALAVSLRTHEIGIRMAFGATPGSVMAMILRQGMLLVLIGVALGVAGSLALTRLLSGLLFGVQPNDPLTLIAVSLLLAGVAAVACLVPARRASTIEPVVALRTE